jgi:hypothetical protein
MRGIDSSRLASPWVSVCIGALLLSGMVVSAQAQAPAGMAAAVAPGSARIWFYSDYEPYGARNYAPVALNGAPVGSVQPDGSAFYRDVPAGHYQITVDSAGTDLNQAKDIDLPPGGEAYVKILSAPNWDSGGGTSMYRRDTFYLSVIPPQIARSELPSHPLTGG